MIRGTMNQMALKMVLSVIALALTFGSVAQAAPNPNTNCPSGNGAKADVLVGVGLTGNDCDDSKVGSTIAGVVKILSYIVGVAAIIMIIVAAFRYITSNGDANRVGSAKSTLIYALIGLAVAALAISLVEFVFKLT